MINTKLPEGRCQETHPSIGNTPISLDIRDGGIGAYAGCNRVLGTAEMLGNQLDTGQLATTLMMCHGEDRTREEALNLLLKNNPQVSYDGNILVLKNDDWDYPFSPQPSLEEATIRFIYVAANTVPCTGVVPMECLQICENKEEPWELHYDQIEGI